MKEVQSCTPHPRNNGYSGQVIYTHRSENKQVITRRTAQEITNMLQLVVSRGTGKRAQLPDDHVAGKTGTTQLALSNVPERANRDIWFAGYTKELDGGRVDGI